MKRCLRNISGFILISLYSAYVCASASINTDINHTLHVYLKNMTNKEIKFNQVIGSNAGNYFSVTPSVIMPGETGVITAEKLINNDIDGQILFLNSVQDAIMVLILDQEQIHYGQPIFSAHGTGYHSVLTSKTRNISVGPRYLTYLKAEMTLFDNELIRQ